VEDAGWAAVGAASSGESMVVRAGGALQHSHGGWTYVETHSFGGVWLPIEETRERWMREMSWTVGASMRPSNPVSPSSLSARRILPNNFPRRWV
jgi:hypothetical protein